MHGRNVNNRGFKGSSSGWSNNNNNNNDNNGNMGYSSFSAVPLAGAYTDPYSIGASVVVTTPNTSSMPMQSKPVSNDYAPIGQVTGGGGGGGGGAESANRFTTFMMTLGVIAFIGVCIIAGVFIWRTVTQQDDISTLSRRISIAESLLVNHTTRLNGLDALLATTIAKVNVNMMGIASNNATIQSNVARIVSLENRTTSLETRMNAAEIKLIGLMINVTILQEEVAILQENVTSLRNDVNAMNITINNHETRIQALELNIAQNNVKLTNLMNWLQGNLTIIDERLNILNVTYTVTAFGTAEVRSNDAIPANVTWQTRKYTDVGLDVEYLWISDSNWNPVMIRWGPPNATWSFEIRNFTTATPVMAIPSPTLDVDRPLMTFQRSKFLIQNEIISPDPAILAATWNNEEVSLQFITNLHLYSSVTIVSPLTFVIGTM